MSNNKPNPWFPVKQAYETNNFPIFKCIFRYKKLFEEQFKIEPQIKIHSWGRLFLLEFGFHSNFLGSYYTLFVIGGIRNIEQEWGIIQSEDLPASIFDDIEELEKTIDYLIKYHAEVWCTQLVLSSGLTL